MQYKLEVYCGVSVSPKFRSQQGTALQMGAYCGTNWRCTASTFQTSCTGWGFLRSAQDFSQFLVKFSQSSPEFGGKTTPRLVVGRSFAASRWLLFGRMVTSLGQDNVASSKHRQGRNPPQKIQDISLFVVSFPGEIQGKGPKTPKL